jgi:hypothetical protein
MDPFVALDAVVEVRTPWPHTESTGNGPPSSIVTERGTYSVTMIS